MLKNKVKKSPKTTYSKSYAQQIHNNETIEERVKRIEESSKAKILATQFHLALLSVVLQLGIDCSETSIEHVKLGMKSILTSTRNTLKKLSLSFINSLKKTEDDFTVYNDYVKDSAIYLKEVLKIAGAVARTERNVFLLYVSKLAAWRNDIAGINSYKTEFLWTTYGDYKYTEAVIHEDSFDVVHTDYPKHGAKCLVRFDRNDEPDIYYYNADEKVFYLGDIKREPIEYLTLWIDIANLA